ncbi:MAG: GLPGLI family protein [Saprospiraceae bacterium]
MKIIKLSTILVLIFLISTINGFSQKSFEGHIRYIQESNWTKRMASLDYISEARKEKMDYMWGNRSGWKMYKNLYIKNNISKYENSEDETPGPERDMWHGKKETFFIYNDFNDMNCTDAFVFVNKDYILQDTLIKPKWKVKNDIKEIAGHICMNATITDTVRRQNIMAWFALDLPGNYGPDRYFGLPGIILEIDIDNGATVISADLIEQKEIENEVSLPKKLKGKQIDFDTYNSMLTDYIKEKEKQEEPWFWGVNF